jgi:hypothetical protein
MRRIGLPREQFIERSAAPELRTDGRAGGRAENRLRIAKVDPFIGKSRDDAGYPRDTGDSAAAARASDRCLARGLTPTPYRS